MRIILFLQVVKPLNQVLLSLVDQDSSHQIEHDNLGSDELQKTYTIEEFEVRILEPEKSGGPWQTRATIPMQNSENALTVRMVTLFVSFLGCPLQYVGLFALRWMLLARNRALFPAKFFFSLWHLF